MHDVRHSVCSQNLRHPINVDGSLKFWAGNIAMHAFSVSFLERVAGQSDALPFHFAQKTFPHFDESGATVKPTEPNAVKFERFIFDLMPLAQRALVVEVNRESVYAPLKNAEGTESADWVRKQITRLNGELLAQAGVEEGSSVEIRMSSARQSEPTFTERSPANRRAHTADFRELCLHQ